MRPLFPPALKYIENVTLNFDGCLVKIAKSNELGRYSIDIDPGEIDFDCKTTSSGIFYTECGYVAYVDLPYRIAPNHAYTGNTEWNHIYKKYDKYDWFIYSKLSTGCNYFSNGDVFGIEDINVILKNIKYGVDFLEFVKRNKVGKETWVDRKYWSQFLSGKYERECEI